jgi:dTDP-4-amino-4,6-dideoxygalactose transaminase
MKIPFSPPYIDDEVKREVLEALDSGWITSGPKVLALEKLVAQQVGINHVACCNSATSGLMLLLHWYGVTRGDEVIIPCIHLCCHCVGGYAFRRHSGAGG